MHTLKTIFLLNIVILKLFIISGNPVADTSNQVADTTNPVADTTNQVADTTNPVGDSTNEGTTSLPPRTE